jgi:hypothetical protein
MDSHRLLDLAARSGGDRGQILSFDIPSPAAVLILLRRRLDTSMTPSWNAPSALGGPDMPFQGTRIAVALAASREEEGLPWKWAAFHGSSAASPNEEPAALRESRRATYCLIPAGHSSWPGILGPPSRGFSNRFSDWSRSPVGKMGSNCFSSARRYRS